MEAQGGRAERPAPIATATRRPRCAASRRAIRLSTPAKGRPIDIEQRINLCRTEQQKAPPFAYESRELLALSAYVGKQSRGMPIAVANDEKTRPFIEAGRKIY